MKAISVIVSTVLVLLVFSSLGAVPVGASQPSLSTGGLNPNIGGYTCSSTKPCPMGVVDYGVNKKAGYSYTSIEDKSWANFTTLSIGVATGGLGNSHMTIQQNTVDYGVYVKGVSGEYWIQDVPIIAQSGKSDVIQAEDNIWNFSSTTASMGPTGTNGNQYMSGALNGDCGGGVFQAGATTYYACGADQSFTTKLPFEVEMVVLTGLDTTYSVGRLIRRVRIRSLSQRSTPGVRGV